MNPVALDFGIIKIYWYSITMLTAILVGTFLFLKQAEKEKINKEFLYDLLFYGIIFGIIGARVYYVMFNLSYYLKNPIEIIEVWNGGLAIHGALLAGGIWFIYYSKKKGYNFLKLFDMAAVALPLCQAIGRWGNFFNQEAHGLATTYQALKELFIPEFIINGMKINGVYYHPTFYYEFLWNILGFIVLIIIRKKWKLKPGQLTGIYFMWYSLARFIIEGMRTDSLMFLNLRVAQIISIILFVIGGYLTFHKQKDTRVSRRMNQE